MNEFNRQIDESKMNESKQRTMEHVMSTIQKQKRPSILSFITKPVLVPTLLLIFALFVIFTTGNDNPVDQPFTVNAQESQKLAEITYISSSLIGANITLSNDIFQLLNTTDITEFEDNNERINVYFDMLKLFLDDAMFSQAVTVTTLTDHTYDQRVEFNTPSTNYILYLSVDDTVITGELHVGIKVFDVSGTFIEEDDEFTISLQAIDGLDYVRIEYQSEGSIETETEYQIETYINGVTLEQKIKVEIENDEAKIEIEEGNDHYKLEREIEDGVVEYKMEYTINGVEGEAKIIEQTDPQGNITYIYQVKEGDKEKEINNNRPDYDYDDDEDEEDDDEDSPGNSEQDDDEHPGNDTPGNDDDEPGNDDDDVEEQSSTHFTKKTIKTL